MRDGFLEDFIVRNEHGQRQLETTGLRERVRQVVGWNTRNVVSKELSHNIFSQHLAS